MVRYAPVRVGPTNGADELRLALAALPSSSCWGGRPAWGPRPPSTRRWSPPFRSALCPMWAS